MSIEMWTLAIAGVTSITCALCGSLLLVGQKSMFSEGLSHAVFPGLVLAFVFTRDYNSPWLILSAGASGMVMVWLTQLVQRSGLVDGDAALGIVFAGMFSVGILVVSASLRNTHFHADCIIDGNLALAALDRLVVGGYDWGPRSWFIMCVMLSLVIAFIAVAFKELKISLFDPLLAKRFGYRPAILHSVWLSVVSMTTVAAFDVAGSVLIVALMIAPPAAAYLLTDRLGRLLVISSAVAVVSSVSGFYLSVAMDISPTGPIASASGMLFLVVFALAPRRGFLANWLSRRNLRVQTNELLVLELLVQDGSRGMERIWIPPRALSRIMDRLKHNGLVRQSGTEFEVTAQGMARLKDGSLI